MTYAEREEMFAKEYLTIADFQTLFGVNYPMASKMITDIKHGFEVKGKQLRLKIQGKIHVQDYLDYYNLPSVRYTVCVIPLQEERKEVAE